jgi:hypothetical protein
MAPESVDSKKCPHCGAAFNMKAVGTNDSNLQFEPKRPVPGPPAAIPGYVPPRQHAELGISCHFCPVCGKRIVWLNDILLTLENDGYRGEILSRTLLYPKQPVYLLPEGVPEPLASDMREAHATLTISPKASAALSRRCLQAIVESKEGINARNLMEQVKKLIALNKIPGYLAQELDNIRIVGNFAAHPKKDENSGEIVEVAPDEAEYTFGVLEQLVQFYFVDLPRADARKKAIEDKFGKK